MATDAERMNVEGRLSRLEGGYDHLATKADVESVRTDLERVRAELKTDIAHDYFYGDAHLKFTLITSMTGLIIVAVGILLAAMRFWLA